MIERYLRSLWDQMFAMRQCTRLIAGTRLCTAVMAMGEWGTADTLVFDRNGGRWVDLSPSFGPSTISWPTDTAGVQHSELAFTSAEHGGIHRSSVGQDNRELDRRADEDWVAPGERCRVGQWH